MKAIALCCFAAFVAYSSVAQVRQNYQDTTQMAGAQDGQKERALRMEYGLNLGSYFANKYTANYYNGSGEYSSTGRQGTLAQIIGEGNTYNYNRIRQQVGYDYTIHQLPTDMRYSPAMMVGLFAAIHFGQRFAFIAESNFSRIRIQDQFTIKLNRFSNIEGDNIERHSINGNEERVDIRLGLQYTFVSKRTYVHPFLESGVIFTDTKVKNSQAKIGGSTLSIIVPGNSQYLPERDYGIGMGVHAGVGLRIAVNEQFGFSLGYSSHYNNINLGKFDEYKFQHALFIRFNLNNVLR